MSSSVSASGTASASASASTSGAPGLGINQDNPTFKIVGICLAIGSGLFIGVSFVIKKKGLIAATAKAGNVAGEGHAYLKNWLWWTGMILMIIGEILNFVAYAFTVAILVTPMGSISVVVAAILSHFILKETLTFFGWIGCTLCILGSIVLALNAPSEGSVRTIKEFMKYFVSPGFLVWMSLCIIASLVLVFWAAPRWGKKSMMPYISVCSLIGGISVSCTQGLGAAIITSIQGESQIKHWFFWFLLVFVIVTLLIEINYLNKALELFNTSMVVPVYFCYFTSATMITSFILYRGLKAPATQLVTMVLGFLVTCLGITLLQLSKVDPKELSGLDRKSTILLQASRHKTEAEEKGEITAIEEPGMDALRGGFGAVGSIIRARTFSRRMSNASGASGERSGYGYPPAMSTHGMDHLPRYKLSDNPMPEDAENIALSPTHHSPALSSATRKATALSFNDSDVVHQYGYTQRDGKTESTHGIRLHDPHSARSRQFSGLSAHSMETVPEGVVVAEKSPSLSLVVDTDVPPRSASPRTPTLRSPGYHTHHQAERKTSFTQLFKSATEDHKHASGSEPRPYPLVLEPRAERAEREALVSARDDSDTEGEREDDDGYGVYSAYLAQESPEMMDVGGDLGAAPMRPLSESERERETAPGTGTGSGMGTKAGSEVSASASTWSSASVTGSLPRKPAGPR